LQYKTRANQLLIYQQAYAIIRLLFYQQVL